MVSSVPEAIRAVLDTVTSDDLRGLVESLSVPRVYGTPENEAVRRLIIDRFANSGFARASIEEDDDGNLIVGDPRQAMVLVGAHYDAVPGTPGADDNASAVRWFRRQEAGAKLVGDQEMRIQVSRDFEQRRQQPEIARTGVMLLPEILHRARPIDIGKKAVVTQAGALEHLGRT